MLGQKVKRFKEHTAVSLEALVPPHNFYRHLEAKLDLSFVREFVKACYATTMGRPSIDPIVFFKLQLIMFFEGIRSERQLMETVKLNLAHRWYIGYDLDEKVPDHSSLSKIRERYGLETFQRFFVTIVERCIEAGLVWGKELYFDGTKVQANAAIDHMIPRFYWDTKQHVQALFASDPSAKAASEPVAASATPRGLVQKYDGRQRLTGRRTPWYQRKADDWVSPTDPDASPMSRFTGDRARLGYHDHYVVDGGKARIILAALVTPASVMDNTPMLDLERWVRFRWHVHPAIAVGDTRYGTTANIVGLAHDGVRAYIPLPDFTNRDPFYPPERFQYDPEQDVFICPQGHDLRRRAVRDDFVVYAAQAKVCNRCPVKAQCTPGKSGRNLSRPIFQAYLDQAKADQATEAYKKAMRKRQVWVEPLFGEAKAYHGLRRFRLRRLWKVNTEGLLIAAAECPRLGQTARPCWVGRGRRIGAGALNFLSQFPPPDTQSSTRPLIL